VLLRAFAIVTRDLPHARLLIVGDGSQRGELEHLAAHLRVPARFTGHVAAEEMEPLLAGAWAQVVPSRYAEGFGNVAVEAAMRGTAVVASDAGGLRDIIEPNQTGLLVAPNDPAALANTLAELFRNRNRAEQLGAAARQRALRHFTEKRMIEDFLGHYRAIAAQPALWQNHRP
jgi:glycosyltransferase involved in cell wall biosynthesis